MILLYFLSASVVLPLLQSCRKPPEASSVRRPAQSPRRFPAFTAARGVPCPPFFFRCLPAGLRPVFSRCGRLPAGSHLPPLAPDAAMARARRRSRTPEGRTERRSRRGHHPGHRPGKVRADAQRHAAGGVQPDSRDKFRVTAKRGVRGCRGCRGAAAPLTPCPTPVRRPAAHAGQQPQCREEQNQRQSRKAPSHPMPHAGQATCRPCRAAAARQGKRHQPQKQQECNLPCAQGKLTLRRNRSRICGPPHAQGNLALKRLSENEIQKNKTGNDQKSIFGKDTLPVVFVHDF